MSFEGRIKVECWDQRDEGGVREDQIVRTFAEDAARRTGG